MKYLFNFISSFRFFKEVDSEDLGLIRVFRKNVERKTLNWKLCLRLGANERLASPSQLETGDNKLCRILKVHKANETV